MKSRLLLKTLQYSAQTVANRQRESRVTGYLENGPGSRKVTLRPIKSEAGFTLLEVITVALIIGILSAIAAPSWQGFITRQRISTINNRVFQALRTAQSDAKLKKSQVTVSFDKNVDPPTLKISDQPSSQTLNADGEIKPGQITLSAQAGSPLADDNIITFDYDGTLQKVPVQALPFIVTISPTQGTAKQCVIVETSLGGMRTAEGTDCTPASPSPSPSPSP